MLQAPKSWSKYTTIIHVLYLQVPDSYPAIRVPNEATTSAGTPVTTATTATLPRRSASNAMTLSDMDPQILSRSGNRSRRNSSASSAPAMGQQPKRSSSCRLGRSCSKHSLCRWPYVLVQGRPLCLCGGQKSSPKKLWRQDMCYSQYFSFSLKELIKPQAQFQASNHIRSKASYYFRSSLGQ